MDERRNHYRVLYLQPDAPIHLVRVNYLTLMQKLNAHPDLGGEHWNAVHLNVAYSVLSDPERRAAYDLELLASYDMATLARSGQKGTSDRSAGTRAGITSRRNYYRVLQVQREAPLEILDASHRQLRKQNRGDTELLDRAFETLGNPKRRRLYDELLGRHGHRDALLHMQGDPSDASPGYQPLITSYCAFCKTPHARDEHDGAVADCDECRSPLFSPPSSLLGLVRRAVSRFQRDDPVTIHLGWPGPSVSGRVVDLSPTGMKCHANAPLDDGDVVKLASRHFDAVGSVAHRGTEAPDPTLGLRFLTVRFLEPRGNFMSMKA